MGSNLQATEDYRVHKNSVSLTRRAISIQIADVLFVEKAEERAAPVHQQCTTPGCPSHGNVQLGECDECYFARQL